MGAFAKNPMPGVRFSMGIKSQWLLTSLVALISAAPLAGFDYRYSMPDDTDPAELIENAELISSKNQRVFSEEHDEWQLQGYADAHGVYALPAELLLAVAADFDAYRDFLPWNSGDGVQEQNGNHYQVHFRSGIRFLGFGIGFELISEAVVEEVGEGRYGIRVRMLEGLHGGLYEHYVSWYLERLIIEGREYTYVRYYNRPGISRPFRGMTSLAGRFSRSNTIGQLEALADEAHRRWQR